MSILHELKEQISDEEDEGARCSVPTVPGLR
jgi:hypothetical protein